MKSGSRIEFESFSRRKALAVMNLLDKLDPQDKFRHIEEYDVSMCFVAPIVAFAPWAILLYFIFGA